MMISEGKVWAFAGAVFLLAHPMATAQESPVTVTMDSLAFLAGTWVGEGGGDAGAGSGYVSFEPGLSGKALLRKNHAEYPASKDRPATIHDDLMIIYADRAAGGLRAFYTDTEGHTINYEVTLSPDGKSVVFRSDPQTVGPRYRLTYLLTQADRISLTFEMAPPDKPDQFTRFMAGSLRKSAAP